MSLASKQRAVGRREGKLDAQLHIGQAQSQMLPFGARWERWSPALCLGGWGWHRGANTQRRTDYTVRSVVRTAMWDCEHDEEGWLSHLDPREAMIG